MEDSPPTSVSISSQLVPSLHPLCGGGVVLAFAVSQQLSEPVRARSMLCLGLAPRVQQPCLELFSEPGSRCFLPVCWWGEEREGCKVYLLVFFTYSLLQFEYLLGLELKCLFFV